MFIERLIGGPQGLWRSGLLKRSVLVRPALGWQGGFQHAGDFVHHLQCVGCQYLSAPGVCCKVGLGD